MGRPGGARCPGTEYRQPAHAKGAEHGCGEVRGPVTGRFDAVVVGGGLAGASAARAMAVGGATTALVDRADLLGGAEGVRDGRTTAVALGSVRALEGMGLWSALAPQAEPMNDIRITDGRSPVFLHYDRREVGDEPFGYIVENSLLRRVFAEALARTPGLTVLAPAELVASERNDDGATLDLADGRRIGARLVVAADGRFSRLRREAGIGVAARTYRQTAIVTTVAHEHPHGNVAHERFLGGGPFAILPMPDGGGGAHRSSIVWSERRDLAARILELPEGRFLEELAWRFGDFLGDLEIAGPRFAYPLGLAIAERMIATRLALVGEAAHAIHPIAGQGFNLGLRDVAVLAEVAVDARRLGFDIGAQDVLEAYQRRRRFDGLVMAAITDGLNGLFSNDVPVLRLVRGLGLAAVGRMPVLKRMFMRHAMGLAGAPPRLLRGEPL